MNILDGEIWKIKTAIDTKTEESHEMQCVVVSPCTMNRALDSVIVIPLMTTSIDLPTRVNIKVKNEEFRACADRIRFVFKDQLIERIDATTSSDWAAIQRTLRAILIQKEI